MKELHVQNLMDNTERPSFEEALKKLEQIVSQLEDESITLEESVNLYEEGVKLSKFCSEILDDAELRIEQVNEVNSQ
jgi:exodeoxyribonuclease VII small subunit